MHERTVVHHQPKETVSQSPIRAICIGFDFGSTAIKFEIHSNLNSDRQLKPVAHAHRHISYPSTTTNFNISMGATPAAVTAGTAAASYDRQHCPGCGSASRSPRCSPRTGRSCGASA